jgi:hypothetical protein
MIDESYRPSVRLRNLPLGAKVTLTAFLALMGAGYLVAVTNIYLHHNEADLEPGLGPGDLLAVYHGLERDAPAGTIPQKAHMLRRVEPGGDMRKYLEKGGEEAVRTLIGWLEAGAQETDFSREGLFRPGDPSPQDVIAENCVRCHNARDGDKKDVPYAESRDDLPTYALVQKEAVRPGTMSPEATPRRDAVEPGTRTIRIEPMSVERLVQVTHVHIISIPVFALAVAALFFLSSAGPRLKAILGPIPMLGVCLDVASWWLARPIPPFALAIGAAGAIFGTSLALQMLLVLRSLWLDRAAGGERKS